MRVNYSPAPGAISLLFNTFVKRTVVLPLVALFVCSCVTSGPYIMPEAVGPAPGVRSYGKEGMLQVFSRTVEFNDGGIQYLPHTSYRIYSTNGSFIKYVRNHTTLTDQRPEMVRLPVGGYSVTAISEGMGVVKVPVIISGSQITAVRLDNSRMKEAEGADEKQLIHFPNGSIAGWKAEAPESK
jgi:hypothetical protein